MLLLNSESRQLLYIPFWAKAAIFVTLVAITTAGLIVAIYFTLYSNNTDLIIIGMGAAQIAATGIIVAIVVLFSESDANIERLESRADQFLRKHIPDALSRITIPGTDAEVISVKCIGNKDIFGHLYHLDGANDFKFKMWVGLNVYRVFVIYFVCSEDRAGNYERKLMEIFKYTFGGAEKIGFHTFYERAQVAEHEVVSIWMSATVKESFLISPTEKLFWAQDVAMMTQSFLRTAIRHQNDINIFTPADPGPL